MAEGELPKDISTDSHFPSSEKSEKSEKFLIVPPNESTGNSEGNSVSQEDPDEIVHTTAPEQSRTPHTCTREVQTELEERK